MRNAFIAALTEEARLDANIWLLCGDIGFSVLEGFAAEFPQRFINVGVAEQNMIGVAAGLALSGKTVFTYTIGNFSFMRCLEQIRNDVCYHNLNVKVVALGGGYAYGAMGYTHHVIEDIAMMRVLPNIQLYAPGDPFEAALAAQTMCHTSGPGYVRLGRGGEPKVHSALPAGDFNKAIVMREGRDATIISSAGTLDIAAQAASQLADSGVSVGLVSMPTLMPFDATSLQKIAATTNKIITIEEHGRGGLGSLVLESCNAQGISVPVKRIFVEKPLSAQSGDRNWYRQLHGITAQAIMDAVKEPAPRR